MAKKVTVTLVDDVDGRTPADETVEFGFDGVTYEIDLSARNAEKLRSQLTTWAEHGRRISGRRRTRALSAPGRGRASIDRAQSVAIRDWARKNGREVSSRGRIPAEVVDAFNAAN
ncbi:Lsr2 family protein [Mycobacteroides abscessus]|uniref:Lsr2 family protein n=1 Tax=Mycobacteroides abscessus TaxID=36809 RepID=A0ABD7HM90_9MYCO|nr:Lsr2 family protein [Mycobacteroides abscessus]RIT36887.1 Lsr2 family protein [Mycobacteroides abscessus]